MGLIYRRKIKNVYIQASLKSDFTIYSFNSKGKLENKQVVLIY